YHLPNPLERNPSLAPLTHNPQDIGKRANANFQSILDYVAWTTASYNGLQLTFDKRFSRGLQFSSNYTWSKSLDENSSSSLAFNGSVPDPFNLRFNRGKSDLNFTHIWTSYGVYELPALKKANALTRGVLGGRMGADRYLARAVGLALLNSGRHKMAVARSGAQATTPLTRSSAETAPT